MDIATILSGIGCAVALWLARKDDARLALAFALLYLWIVATSAYHADALLVLAVADVLVAALAACMGRCAATDEIVILSVARVGLHFARVMGAPFEAFAWTYNLTFAAMLASVASDGGLIGGARSCFRALLDRGDGNSGGTFRVAASHPPLVEI